MSASEIYEINRATEGEAARPSHYVGRSGAEAIDVMRDFMGDEELLGFLRGNVIKYALRCRAKGQLVSDVDKMAEYAALLSRHLHDMREG